MCGQTSVTVGAFGRRFRTEHMCTKTQPGMAPRGADEMAALQERIAALGAIQLPTLRDEWWRLYQTPPPRRLSRDLLIRGIAYKLQENAHGGLSKATQRRLRTLAKTFAQTGRVAPGRGPRLRPGARLVRQWRGRTYVVTVTETGFEYTGKQYRSLSSIARRITGAHWSGPRFFGVQGAPRAKGSP